MGCFCSDTKAAFKFGHNEALRLLHYTEVTYNLFLSFFPPKHSYVSLACHCTHWNREQTTLSLLKHAVPKSAISVMPVWLFWLGKDEEKCLKKQHELSVHCMNTIKHWTYNCVWLSQYAVHLCCVLFNWMPAKCHQVTEQFPPVRYVMRHYLPLRLLLWW